MSKLKMHSPNIVDNNIEKIRKLFPNCITERKNNKGEIEMGIDFEMLRQELSNDLIEGSEERYQFTWPNKRQSILLANAPIAKTLRPCREESVDFDTTENLYIEGDNLDVLKLLQETYLGKVKMIYIDPPYNTGSDFVYEDDFSQSTDEYFANSGQYDNEGNRLVKNLDSNGRFHTDWLNMMYPRLRLAKDLLTDDGVIFISIDENESHNLRKICDEVFGERNLLGVIANVNNPKGRSDDAFIATSHEYLLVYSRDINSASVYGFEPDEKIIKRYNKIDFDGSKYREIDLRKTGDSDSRIDRPNMFYYFYADPNTLEIVEISRDKIIGNLLEITPLKDDGSDGRWRWGYSTANERKDKLIVRYMPTRKIWGVFEKDFLDGRPPVKSTSSWTHKDVNSERGSEQMINLGFNKETFSRPKPVGTVKRIIEIGTLPKDKSIVLDFFSGSGVTAQAVFELVGDCKRDLSYILVQIPEETDENSKAREENYINIPEIGKERIRRAAKKIKDEKWEKVQLEAKKDGVVVDYIDSQDYGFRVLKLDSTNMKDVYYDPKLYTPELFSSLADNIKDDRTPEDLLFQVMLDLGVLLSSKIEDSIIDGKKVFNVEENYLIACFDDNVTDETITAIAKQKPYYFVMRDSSMASDSVASNFEQIFETYSKETVRRVL